MKRRIFITGVFMLCSLVAVVSLAVSATKLPIWKPDKALLPKLADAVKVGSYQIQPPKGYEEQEMRKAENVIIYGWIGAARDNGTRPSLMISIITPPAGEEGKYTLNQIFTKALSGIERRRTKWKQTPTETGTINDLTFLRAYWTGIDKETGMPMRGFSYMTQSGKSFIQISSQDVEPHHKKVLPLAEASTLTFKKP